MPKQKLTIEEQIEHMRDVNGILFNEISEQDAAQFLSSSTYYFKVKSYAKVFSKYHSGDNKGKYYQVDFAYLRELSILDALLRKQIIKISLDIEHYLKVELLEHVAGNEDEDGYSIVQEYFQNNPDLWRQIVQKGKTSTCKDLVEKYKDGFAIWNIVEVLTFREFMELYQLYFSKYKRSWPLKNLLMPVKFLRNAAAHNNCLLNHLNDKTIEPNNQIANFVSKFEEIPKKSKEKKLKNSIMHDFVATLYVFDECVTNKKTKRYVLGDLKHLLDSRFTKNSHFFEKEALLVTSYSFIKIIVDYFYDKCE